MSLCAALGASYGTAKSGTGIASMSVARPDLIMKSIIPVVMAGIIAIYGLVVAALVANAIKAPPDYSLYQSVCTIFHSLFWFTSAELCIDCCYGAICLSV